MMPKNKDINNLVNYISHVDVITCENKTYYYYYIISGGSKSQVSFTTVSVTFQKEKKIFILIVSQANNNIER